MAMRFTFAGLFERFKSRRAGISQGQPRTKKGLMGPRSALGEKYSEEAYRQVRSIYRGSHGADRRLDRDMKKTRLRSIYQLANHPKLDKKNLPTALAAADATTLGTVMVVLDHPKMRSETVPAAMQIIRTTDRAGEDSGRRKVFTILEHPKTTRENAHTFLEAADEYGYNNTVRFIGMDGVDAGNIKKRLRSYKSLSKTQQIKVE